MKTRQTFSRLFILFSLIFIFSTSTVISQIANPSWYYEIIYDDGSAEDFAAWIESGGQVAVKFTPPYYPFKILGGELYVGDGYWPEGGNWLGTDVVICLYDDDGVDDMPGTLIDSVRITVNNYEWLVFDSIFDYDFFEGDFYLGMMQIGTAPDVAPIGIDTDNPIWNRSYAMQAGGEWFLSPYQDYMIRAFIDNATGEKEILQSHAINIYPNPASSTVNISSEKEITRVMVFNQIGQKVFESDNIKTKETNIDISLMAKGIYVLNIEIGETKISKKLIVKP